MQFVVRHNKKKRLNGLILGTIISTIAAPLWVEPKVLFKHYFKKPLWEYFKRYLIDLLIMIIGSVVIYFICLFIPDGSILLLIAKFVVCILCSGLFLLVAYSRTKELKKCLEMLKMFIKKLYKKHN